MRLTWTFAGLFVLFGLPLLVVEDAGWGRFWAGLSTLCLGGFGLSWAVNTVRTGSIKLQHATVTRAARPLLFRAVVALLVVTGLVVTAAGFWFLFLKTS